MTRLLVSGFTTGLMMFGVSVAATPPASAAACTTWNPSANGEGAGYMNISTHLKNNYYSGCDNVASVSYSTLVYFRCFKYNASTGHWWVYVRVAGTSTSGWTSFDNVNDLLYDDNGDGYYDAVDC
ncbi:hypothetical protein ASD08_18500 [Streptomyces sp. Root369]|nr:hypothetical protein ASD08_18500 [Streptomyces sp. Root369]